MKFKEFITSFKNYFSQEGEKAYLILDNYIIELNWKRHKQYLCSHAINFVRLFKYKMSFDTESIELKKGN